MYLKFSVFVIILDLLQQLIFIQRLTLVILLKVLTIVKLQTLACIIWLSVISNKFLINYERNITVSSGGNGVNINYPLAFTTVASSVAIRNANSTTTTSGYVYLRGGDKTGFNCYSPSSTTVFNYIAVGY